MNLKSHQIGKVIKPKGIKGEVLIKLFTDFPKNLKRNTVLYLQEDLFEKNRLLIEKIVCDGGIATIKFYEVNTREKAQELKGFSLFIPSCKSPKLPANSYWIYQIIGLDVYDENDRHLGKIEEIMRTKVNDIYIVRKEGDTCKKKEYLIPAIKDIVKKIDLNSKKMVIKMMAGMEDI